ncbi:hypothetical protein, partial [Clavibacter michiganensis]|uniref:hypothetical protein n=1 Tax=Clavibacter michiganensis TaxID=28447 RepID=UPI00292EBC70
SLSCVDVRAAVLAVARPVSIAVGTRLAGPKNSARSLHCSVSIGFMPVVDAEIVKGKWSASAKR